MDINSIDEGFCSYVEASFQGQFIPVNQYIELRRACFAGAAIAWQVIGKVNAEGVTEDQAMRMLAEFEQELDNFHKDLMNGEA